MRITRGTAPGALRLAGHGQELPGEARRRLKWMDYYENHRHNARLTCRHFDRLLQDWERVDNTIRPHQALGYRTPAAFLQQLDTYTLSERRKCTGGSGRVHPLAKTCVCD
mgnify:CR=1 FL=1